MKKMVKDTMKIGIGSMAGMAAMGAMSGISGMPKEAGTTVGIASAGLNLANVGQLAKTGMGIAGMMSSNSSGGKKKIVHKDHHPIVKKILGGY